APRPALHSFPTRRSSDLVTALSPFWTCHERSVGTGPASMSERSPCIIAAGRSRVLSRRRSERGLTKEISNGSTGSRSYSVPGNRSEEHTSELQSLAYLVC